MAKRNVLPEGDGEWREKCEESVVFLGFQSYISSTFNLNHPIHQRLIFVWIKFSYITGPNEAQSSLLYEMILYYLIYLLIYSKIDRLRLFYI
jgi:hypothetical protein